MTARLPFTEASIARAIRGVERAGRFVIGMRPDGTLLIGDKPLDVGNLVASNEPASSKWEDHQA